MGIERRAFQKVVYVSCILQIDEEFNIKTILIYQKNLDLYKFCNISVNFEDTKNYENLITRLFQYYMYRIEYCNNCVLEKLPHLLKTI